MIKFDPKKHIIGTKALVESMVYLGHKKAITNPKMKKYIYKKMNRQNYSIDLSKTLDCLLDAYTFLMNLVKNKEDAKILFVGTKPKAKAIISEEALRCGALFIDERWLGGTLTNASTVNSRISKWVTLERTKKDTNFTTLTKKERMLKEKEIERLTKHFRGIRVLKGLPDVIFLVDIEKEKVALAEANQFNIPVIAMVNTNVNPEKVTYPIPANDEDPKSIKLITGLMADAILEAKGSQDLEFAHKLDAVEPRPKTDRPYPYDKNKRYNNRNKFYSNHNETRNTFKFNKPYPKKEDKNE